MYSTVQLSVLDPRLRQALYGRLQRMEGLDVQDPGVESIAGDPRMEERRIVIVLATETEAEDCEVLRNGGAEIIVLAPIARDGDRDRYLSAGVADYLPMDIRGDALEVAIRRLTDREV